MDLLTHIFFPMTILYALKRRSYFLFSFFAILPDLDKFFIPGALHSVLTLIPVILLLFLFLRKEYCLVAAFFIFSHLFLDILDGGPVPLLYPIERTGIGIEFPMRVSFHSFSFSGEVVRIVYEEPKIVDSYEIFSGFGFAILILFFFVYLGMRRGWGIRN